MSGIVIYYVPRAGADGAPPKEGVPEGLPQLKLMVASDMYVEDLEGAY